MDLQRVKDIHGLFKRKRLTLAAAESCTGGLISHYMTMLPGASLFFRAGVVAYSAEIKTGVLGISRRFLKRYGIVSEETAAEMAKKVRKLTGADIAVSSTGNLGPDVLEGKPKGLVFIAVSAGKITVTRRLQLKGTRSQIKTKAVQEAFSLLEEVLTDG